GNVNVGFIGVHAEGCMGMLFVMPRFRRCGYGREMELFMTGEMMRAGLYPYGQVFVTNKASLELQKTTVYSPGETEMFWFIIK
ncbi:MAG: N-acetyltransferase, partial [Clostridia bacterium]|nr:N-acetyltransferase [Clostridia bacterium]